MVREAKVRRQQPAYPVILADEARPLKESLHSGVYDRILRIIDGARNGVAVSQVTVRRSIEPEDATWEQIVFEVRVDALHDEANAYWARISEAEEVFMDSLEPLTKKQLARTVAVHVEWL